MSRFAVRLVSDKGKPADRPVWIAKTPRKSVDFGSYVGPSYMVTDQPEQAMTWAKATTAADWARLITGRHPDIRSFEAVHAPEGAA